MFMLTQLASPEATRNAGCPASNFLACAFSKRAKISGFIMERQKRVVKFDEPGLKFQGIVICVLKCYFAGSSFFI